MGQPRGTSDRESRVASLACHNAPCCPAPSAPIETPRTRRSMLKPTVQIHNEEQALVAEFWDCLRLDQAPVKELRNKYEAHLRSNGPPMLVLDLLGVGFAGSAALGLFV